MYIVYIHILHTRDIPSTLDNQYGINNGFKKKKNGEGRGLFSTLSCL